jgi:hypothetical protein
VWTHERKTKITAIVVINGRHGAKRESFATNKLVKEVHWLVCVEEIKNYD